MTAQRRTEITVTVVGAPDTPGRDVRIAGPSAMRWPALREALLAAGHRVPDPAWIGPRRLDDSALGDIPNGSVIAPAPLAVSGNELLRIECTRGPVIGRGLPLGRRPVTVGRSVQADLCLADPDLSRLHCRIDLTAGRVTATDLGSTNGTRLDDGPLPDGAELRSGAHLRLGNSSLALGSSPAPAAPVQDGWTTVHRAPARLSAPATVRLAEPSPPSGRDRRALPWLMIFAPLVIGVGLAWWLHTMMFLAFALFSPVLMLAQHVADKREGRTSRRRELADHAAAVARHEAKIAAALAAERHLRERAAPPLIDAVHAIRAVDQRLWHRHPAEHGYLHWRIGTGTTPSAVVVTDAEGSEVTTPLNDAPVVVDLADHRVTGVVAPAAVQRALLSSLVIQTAAWHSPRHVRIAVITRSRSVTDPELAWLPHLRAAGHRSLLFSLDDPEELTDFLRGRIRDDDTSAPPSLLVVVLDGESTCAAAELAELTAAPSRFGATVVSFAHVDTHLPDRAHPVLRATSTTHVRVDQAQPAECVPDLPDASLLAGLARRAAPLRDAVAVEGGEPPVSVGLAETWSAAAGHGLLDRTALQRHWLANPRPSMRTMLGTSAAGPVVVDLTVDGPHALVAGTTGAGKSELLQTMIASLAAGNRPDALNFVLIDYKGGAAFRECARLPHTVGLVTDLDGHLTERALTSLGAELRRRERALAEAGATDLDDYHRHSDNPTIARLVLVIDEFRVLAEELPEFVDGLVRLATVGRSLGVHLVLATQRPAGVVSADIRANVNLRIALRVRDEGDSHDVIETAAAARLSATIPGRAYLRCGGGEPVLFQTARSTVPPLRDDAVLISPSTPGPEHAGHHGAKVLERLVDLTSKVATDVAVQRSPAPWLPPLPDRIDAADPSFTDAPCVTVSGAQGPGAAAFRFALADCPERQDRPPLAWSPASDQHLAVVGGPRSGRTTAIRALLASALSAGEVHAYVLDLGRSLSDLTDHPGIGAVVGPDEPRRVERVLDHLSAEVAARRSTGAGDAPALLLAIDGWDVLDGLADDAAMFRLIDLVTTILRDGPAADVHVVATGGRGLLTSRSLSLFRSQIALSMADRDDLAAMGVPRKAIPMRMPAGRGVTAPDGMELQIVEAGETPGPTPRVPVHRIDAVPDSVSDVPHMADAIAIGVGADGPVGLPLGRMRDALGLVAGPVGSGRTTALRAIAASLADRPICWVSPDASVALPHKVFRASGTAETTGWLAAHPSGAVLVDDVAAIIDTDLEDPLHDFAARASTTGAVLFAAGEVEDLAGSYRGLIGELRRRATGVLLMPSRTDGELFGLRCPKLDRSHPGRGYRVHRGELTELQIAHSPTESA